MPYRIGKATIGLAAAALVCYVFAWTGVAIGLAVFGMLFEAFSFVSSMRDDERHESRSKADIDEAG